MSKFTPGPWFLKPNRKYQEILISCGAEPRLGYTSWDGIAVVYGSEDTPDIGFEVAEANAALIAAAPDMYEALRNMLASAIPGMNWTDEIGQVILEQASAALMKAEGKS